MTAFQAYADICNATMADDGKVVNLRTMKIHWASERTRVIKRLGPPDEYSTAPFETAHAPVKADYRCRAARR